MISFAWYGLQVIICSGIMMLYYWLVLRNKRFHQYNRFYILASVFLAFIIPFVKIQLDKATAEKGMAQMIYVFADYNATIDAAVAKKGFQVDWTLMLFILYVVVSVVFLITFLVALIKIYKLLKTFPGKKLEDVWLILTNAGGTPFSFFKFIFWNEEIDMHSVTGKQILQHELTHVKEKHSIDTMIMQIVLTIGWINPFFWLAKRELNMIHEFIADKKSVEDGDTASFAAMLLAATYPKQQHLLTHPFFFSPIKRRLLMLTNHKNPRFSYARRVVILPLMAIVVLLFAFRMKQEEAKGVQNSNTISSILNMIDTTLQPEFGKGVSNNEIDEFDAILKENLSEKKLVNGKVVMIYKNIDRTRIKRAYDIFKNMNQEQRSKYPTVSFAKLPPATKNIPSQEQLKTWLDSKMYGVWIDDKRVENNSLMNFKYSDFSLFYVSKLAKNAINYGKHYYQVGLYTNKYFETNLKKDTSIIIGMHNAKSLAVTSISNKDSIFAYSQNANYSNNTNSVTTTPNLTTALIVVDGKKQEYASLNKINPNTIVSINVLKGEGAEKYGDEGKNGVIEIKTKPAKPLYVLNLKVMPRDFDISKIASSDIESINVLKGEDATKKYGEQGKNGVILITTKKHALESIQKEIELQIDTLNKKVSDSKKSHEQTGSDSFDKIFTQAQVPASFPGGKEGWLKYLERNLNRDLPVEKGAPPGKYTVIMNFIVSKTGSVSEVVAENDPGYGTKDEALRIIKKGPMWIPAEQNGNKVTSLVRQTVTFVISEEK